MDEVTEDRAGNEGFRKSELGTGFSLSLIGKALEVLTRLK